MRYISSKIILYVPNPFCKRLQSLSPWYRLKVVFLSYLKDSAKNLIHCLHETEPISVSAGYINPSANEKEIYWIRFFISCLREDSHVLLRTFSTFLMTRKSFARFGWHFRFNCPEFFVLLWWRSEDEGQFAHMHNFFRSRRYRYMYIACLSQSL